MSVAALGQSSQFSLSHAQLVLNPLDWQSRRWNHRQQILQRAIASLD